MSITRIIRHCIRFGVIFGLSLAALLTPTNPVSMQDGDSSAAITPANVDQLTSRDVYATPNDTVIDRLDWVSAERSLFAAYAPFTSPGVWVYDANERNQTPLYLDGPGAFSPDGTLWAAQVVGGEDVFVNLFDVTAAERIASLPQERPAIMETGRLAFSPDSSLIAATTWERLDVWSLDGLELLFSDALDQGAFVSIDFNADGSLLAAGGDYGAVAVWETGTGARLFSATRHMNPVRVSFHIEQDMLASSSVDRSVNVWDARTGERLLYVQGQSDLISARLSLDANRLFVSDATVRVDPYSVLTLWDISTGSRIAEILLPDESAYYLEPGNIALNQAGDTVAFWNTGPDLLIVDAMSGEVRYTLSMDEPITGASYSPVSDLLLVWHESGVLRFWDAATGQPLRTIETVALADAIFSPDGSNLITAHSDGSIQSWRIP